MLGKDLLPVTGSVPGPVKGQSKFTQKTFVTMGIFTGELNVEVSLCGRVEVRAPHVIDHDMFQPILPAMGLCLRVMRSCI